MHSPLLKELFLQLLLASPLQLKVQSPHVVLNQGKQNDQRKNPMHPVLE